MNALRPERREPAAVNLSTPTSPARDTAIGATLSASPGEHAQEPRSGARAMRRATVIALAVSVGLHLATVTGALLLMRHGTPVLAVPEKPAAVELVMVEHKGDLAPTSPGSAGSTPSPAAPEQKPSSRAEPTTPATQPPVAAKPDVPKQTDAPSVASVPSPATEPATATPAPETPPAKAATAPVEQAPSEAAAPATPAAPKISLAGTDSPSEARAFGPRILPARPDAVFHNRPPIYPNEAALNGEHGTVVVLIHVSPAGTTSSVDVVRSSGYALLDRAARDAVMRWRFLPAVEDGQPVASDMTMGFIFDNQ